MLRWRVAVKKSSILRHCVERYKGTSSFSGTDSERTRSVTSFYYQSAIDQAASKASVRLMPATMLYSGRSADGSHLLRSAQYLYHELPIRIAHRIVGFRRLPFIVGCNPAILSVHELYIRAFHLLQELPQVTDMEIEKKFSMTLTTLLDEHKDVVTTLSEGFRETRKHIEDASLIKDFLDEILTSRLATRLLCEHHLLLHEEKANYIGIIAINFSPKTLVEKKVEYTRSQCIEKYGSAPDVRLTGHVTATFSYIPQPLDYVIQEVLKNAMRATVEYHVGVASDRLPPITVTLVNNDTDFIIKVSDHGGGIRHDHITKVWDYGFSSSGSYEAKRETELFDAFVENRNAATMHGSGFGLPMCKAYVTYLYGDMTIESMYGMGTDVYIRLRHIDGKLDSFRI